MKPVFDAFLDLFSNLFSLVFFLNYGYLCCLTCKNNKKTMKEQRVKRQRKTTKIIFNSKKEFLRVHSFMTAAKSLKFEPPPFSAICINIQF